MTDVRPTLATLKDPVHLLALGLGTGLARVGPGTAGTLLAVLPAWLMTQWPWMVRAGIVGTTFVIGVWLCGESARRLGVHDHPAIVWDEIVGFLAVCLVIPPGILWFVAAFGLFRLFDIVKPWPIRDLDHSLGGGIGIMLDDLVAAGYGAACLLLYQYFFP
ncbi:MAG: phosphatidylglycerophosphatase A [Gammaproteobacteria bacterium]|nr:phosphatidylglycerophosphatase A [Gammaproteobacteria bacterium]